MYIHLEILPTFENKLKFNKVKFSKFQRLFLKIKCRLSELEFTNCSSEKQTRKTLVRLLHQKQSDLGLQCLSGPFWQTISIQFTVLNVPGGILVFYKHILIFFFVPGVHSDE